MKLYEISNTPQELDQLIAGYTRNIKRMRMQGDEASAKKFEQRLKKVQAEKANLSEMQFQDYVPTEEELDQEIAQAQRAMEMARQQGKAPMVAKYEQRIEQLTAKKAQLAG